MSLQGIDMLAVFGNVHVKFSWHEAVMQDLRHFTVIKIQIVVFLGYETMYQCHNPEDHDLDGALASARTNCSHGTAAVQFFSLEIQFADL
jgi:hypothetical protein